jgi:hypothetical protein
MIFLLYHREDILLLKPTLFVEISIIGHMSRRRLSNNGNAITSAVYPRMNPLFAALSTMTLRYNATIADGCFILDYLGCLWNCQPLAPIESFPKRTKPNQTKVPGVKPNT